MIRTIDIFNRDEGQGFDLTQGVDVVDFFNAGIAKPFNELEQKIGGLDIESNVNSEDSTALSDLENSRQNRKSNVKSPMDFAKSFDFGFESQFDTDNTSKSLSDTVISQPSDVPKNEASGNKSLTSLIERKVDLPNSEPFTSKTGVRVLDVTRDQLKSRKSVAGARIFSQDFNDDGTSKKVKGIEIVVPSDATEEELQQARAWVQKTHKTFKDLGVDVPIRRGDGIKMGGRGVKGFFHMEDHFLDDTEARQAIKDNPQLFANATASTLGTLSGATFINPHKSKDPGAIGSDGIGERDFSKKYRTPYLSKALSNNSQ